MREFQFSVVSEPEPAVATVAAAGAAAAPAAPQFTVVKKQKFHPQPMTIEEAIMQMNLMHETFFVFARAETRHVNVVYRRKDDTYGLIETGNGGAAG